MKRGGPLRRKRALQRKTRLNDTSSKRRQALVARRQLRADMLAAQPWCERCQAAPAVDLHELKRRSQGGDPLDPRQIALLCRRCHSHVTEHPQQAHDEGWVRWSWESPYRNDLGETA